MSGIHETSKKVDEEPVVRDVFQPLVKSSSKIPAAKKCRAADSKEMLCVQSDISWKNAYESQT
jgi:hypothetical protein